MNKIKESIIKAGKAMLAVGLQNTHCGNISVRVNDEIFITKTNPNPNIKFFRFYFFFGKKYSLSLNIFLNNVLPPLNFVPLFIEDVIMYLFTVSAG